MPTNEQIVNLLFKKYFGVSDSESSRRIFEEPFSAKKNITNLQIYSQNIPSVNPLTFSATSGVVSGVIQVLKQVILQPIPGAQFSFFSSQLIDAIEFNYDPAGSYNWQLYKNDGVTLIPFGVNDWFIDTAGGILRFYDGLPPGVSETSPPKINFYKYVGTKGVSAGTINNIVNAGGVFGFGLFKNITNGGSTANFYNINTISSALTITLDSLNNKYDFNIAQNAISHNLLADLTVGDPHSSYAFLPGRGPSQQLHGGNEPAGNLILQGTSDLIRGAIICNDKLVVGDNNGTYGTKVILPVTGINKLFEINFSNTGIQHILIDVSVIVWNNINNTTEILIGTYAMHNDALGNVVVTNIFEKASNAKFTFIPGFTDNTMNLNYVGNANDVASYKCTWLLTGQDHFSDITII